MALDDRPPELIGGHHGLLELDEFRVEVLASLRRAVPADWASLNEIGSDPASAVVIADPVRPHRRRSPDSLLGHPVGGGLHALELYTEVYAPMGVEYQIAFTLPSVAGRILGIALSRADRDVSDDERDLPGHQPPHRPEAPSSASTGPCGLPAAPRPPSASGGESVRPRPS